MGKQSTQIQSEIERVMGDAMYAAASVLQTEAMDYIPIWKGDLRNETTIEKRGGKVWVQSGGPNSISYAAYQYFNSLRHWLAGGQYNNIADLGGVGGSLDKEKYRRGLEFADDNDLLTEREAKWFERAFESPGVESEMRAAAINTIKELL